MLLGFVLCVLCVLCVPWCGLLIRTWACCSEPGQPRPRTGQAARVRNRRPACGIGGSRAKEGVQPYTRLAAMRASSLCGAWAFSSARGPAVPSLGNPAHVRDRRPACGTRWNPSRCCMRPIRICACCRWVHDPIGWRCTPSDWVQRSLTGAALPNGCSAL